jgi:hypothetical protein
VSSVPLNKGRLSVRNPPYPAAEYVYIGEKKLDLWIADVCAINLFVTKFLPNERAFRETHDS